MSSEEDHRTRTANTVWDSSVVLAKFFEESAARHREGLAEMKTAVELGAGQGVAGMSFSALFPAAKVGSHTQWASGRCGGRWAGNRCWNVALEQTVVMIT